MSLPSELPRWGTALANPSDIVDPTSGKKDIGWQDGEMPPHSYMNWLFNTIYLWCVYLNGLQGEALTWTAAHVFSAGVTFNGAVIFGSGGSVTFNNTPSFTKGITVTQSTTNGNAVSGTGNGTGAGGVFTGGATNGTGVRGTGTAFGPGGVFQGGASGASGATGLGTGNGSGFDGTGAGSGSGAKGTSSGTSGSRGVYGIGANAAGTVGGYFQTLNGDPTSIGLYATAASGATAFLVDGGAATLAANIRGAVGGQGLNVQGGGSDGVSLAAAIGLQASGGDGDAGSGHPDGASGAKFFGGGADGGGAGGWAAEFTGAANDDASTPHGVWLKMGDFRMESGVINQIAAGAGAGVNQLKGTSIAGSLLTTGNIASSAGNVSAGTTGSSFPIPAQTTTGLTNGWVNQGGAAEPWGYWKDIMGVVHIEGLLDAGAASSGNIVTLPSGFRPLATIYWDVQDVSNGSNQRITVSTAGVINYTGAIGGGGLKDLTLHGLHFRTV